MAARPLPGRLPAPSDHRSGSLGVHIDDPATLAAYPAAPHVEDLHRRQQVVGGEPDHVGVGAVAEHHGLLLHGSAQRAEVVPQPGRPLEVQLGGRLGHLSLQPADHLVGLAGHEVAERLDDLAVLVGRHPADARGGALADVAEQARSADLRRPPEHAGASRCAPGTPAAAGRGSPGSPRHARTGRSSGPPCGAAPRITCSRGNSSSNGDRELRVGLVVAVPDVEPRVELLDPVVFQLQRLDLGGHHRPLHRGRGRDHLRGARVQPGEVGEVGVQPLPQALGLADVDDPAGGVPELVDTGRVRESSRRPGDN